jgi:hypothetical protein
MIEESEDVVLSHAGYNKPAKDSSFRKKLREAQANKQQWKQELKDFVSDPEVQAYYKDPENILW